MPEWNLVTATQTDQPHHSAARIVFWVGIGLLVVGASGCTRFRQSVDQRGVIPAARAGATDPQEPGSQFKPTPTPDSELTDAASEYIGQRNRAADRLKPEARIVGLVDTSAKPVLKLQAAPELELAPPSRSPSTETLWSAPEQRPVAHSNGSTVDDREANYAAQELNRPLNFDLPEAAHCDHEGPCDCHKPKTGIPQLADVKPIDPATIAKTAPRQTAGASQATIKSAPLLSPIKQQSIRMPAPRLPAAVAVEKQMLFPLAAESNPRAPVASRQTPAPIVDRNPVRVAPPAPRIPSGAESMSPIQVAITCQQCLSNQCDGSCHSSPIAKSSTQPEVEEDLTGVAGGGVFVSPGDNLASSANRQETAEPYSDRQPETAGLVSHVQTENDTDNSIVNTFAAQPDDSGTVIHANLSTQGNAIESEASEFRSSTSIQQPSVEPIAASAVEPQSVEFDPGKANYSPIDPATSVAAVDEYAKESVRSFLKGLTMGTQPSLSTDPSVAPLPEVDPQSTDLPNSSQAIAMDEQPEASPELPSLSPGPEATNAQPGQPQSASLPTQLDRVIEMFRSQLGECQDERERDRLLVNLRLADMLQRQTANQTPSGRKYDDDQLQSLQLQLDVLSAMLIQHQPQDISVRNRTLDQLKRAVAQLQSAADLRLANGEFCTSISGFGQLTPFASSDFSSNQQILIYCEVENQTSLPATTETGLSEHRTRLRGSCTIYDHQGDIVQQVEFPEIVDRARQPRKDFYLYFPLTLNDLSTGAYRLELQVEDLDGNKSASLQPAIEFEVR